MVAKKTLEAFSSYGLGPLGLILSKGDQLFAYNLTFSLFSGRGRFRVDAEKWEINFNNARDQKDLNLIYECILKALQGATSIESHFIQIGSHACFKDKTERDRYFERFQKTDLGIVDGGIIAYAPFGPSKETIRFQIERSHVHSDGLYVGWTMTTKAALNQELCNAIQTSFREFAQKFELTIMV